MKAIDGWKGEKHNRVARELFSVLLDWYKMSIPQESAITIINDFSSRLEVNYPTPDRRDRAVKVRDELEKSGFLCGLNQEQRDILVPIIERAMGGAE